MYQPLADELRPTTLDDVYGQEEILGEGRMLRRMIESGRVPNLIFYGPSGTGKTTHIKLWQRLYGDRVEIINGDKPLFTLRSGRFFASGMPWCGKENWGCNKTVPLKAICFIDRAEQNSISCLEDNREIMSRLFLQLVMPEEHRLMVKYLDFANKLINTVPFYLLRCNMELSAAQTAHDGIFGIE